MEENARLREKDDKSQAPTSVTISGFLLIQLACGLYYMVDEVSSFTMPQYIFDRAARSSPLYKNITSVIANCHDNTSDPVHQAKEETQKIATRWSLYNLLANNIVCIVMCIVLGSNSDRFGRRWLFFIPNVGSCIKLLIYAANSHWSLPLWILPIGHFLDGLCGSFIVVGLGVILCSADVTRPDNTRSSLITAVEAILGLVFALADFACGYEIRNLGFSGTFLLSFGLVFLNFIVIFNMPETLRCQTERKSIAIYVKNTLNFYIKKSTPRLLYRVTLGTFSIATLVITGRGAIRTLYTINDPFCWDSVKIGTVGAITNIVQPILAVTSLKIFQCCMTDSSIGALSAVIMAAAFFTAAFATSDVHLYIAAVLRFPVYLIQNMLRSIMSKSVAPQQQGWEDCTTLGRDMLDGTGTISDYMPSSGNEFESIKGVTRRVVGQWFSNGLHHQWCTTEGVALSSFAAVEAIVYVFGAALFNSVYEVTVGWYRGTVFLVMGAIIFSSTGGFIMLNALTKRNAHQSTGDTKQNVNYASI